MIISILQKIASNNNVEYTVIDEQSVRDESNISIEASYSFNDLAPFAVNDKKLVMKIDIKQLELHMKQRLKD